MTDGRNEHGDQRGKTQTNQQGSGDRHWHAEPPHSLEKGSKRPTDQQPLHPFIGCQAR